MPSIRRSAKQVITEMAITEMKTFDESTERKEEYRCDLSRNMIFAFEMIAMRMDWTDLQNKLKRWRSESLRAGLTQTKGT